MYDDFGLCTTIPLTYGVGNPSRGGCWMVALNHWMGNKVWSDKVECVQKNIRGMCIGLNDSFPDFIRENWISEHIFTPLNTAFKDEEVTPENLEAARQYILTEMQEFIQESSNPESCINYIKGLRTGTDLIARMVLFRPEILVSGFNNEYRSSGIRFRNWIKANYPENQMNRRMNHQPTILRYFYAEFEPKLTRFLQKICHASRILANTASDFRVPDPVDVEDFKKNLRVKGECIPCQV